MKKRFLMYVVLSLYLTTQLIACVDQHDGIFFGRIFFLEAFDLRGLFGEGVVVPLPPLGQVEFDDGDVLEIFHHSGDFERPEIFEDDVLDEHRLDGNPREIIEGSLMRGIVASEILGRLGMDEVPGSEEGCLRRLADYILEHEIYVISEVLSMRGHILGPDSLSVIGMGLHDVFVRMGF